MGGVVGNEVVNRSLYSNLIDQWKVEERGEINAGSHVRLIVF